MTTWIIDVKDRVGQRVLPDASSPPDTQRFRKVQDDTLAGAMDRPQFEVVALNKLKAAQSGQSVVMSDKELDWLIDQDVYPNNLVSIPNPQRYGILDAYLVADRKHPAVKAYGDKVIAAYEAKPEIQQYRQQLLSRAA